MSSPMPLDPLTYNGLQGSLPTDQSPFFLTRIAFPIARKTLRYLATPMFVILGISYYNKILYSKDPFAQAGFLSLLPNGIDSLSQHKNDTGIMGFIKLPCDKLLYTDECPKINATPYVGLHRDFFLRIVDYQADYIQLLNNAIYNSQICPLSDTLSIVDKPLLNTINCVLPFFEEFLWHTAFTLCTFITIMERSFNTKERSIKHYPPFLEKYAKSQYVDRNYCYLILQNLSHNYVIPVERSLNQISNYFSLHRNSIYINPIEKPQLDKFLLSEKVKLSKLLLLKKILSKHHKSTKIIWLFLLILLDLWCFMALCYHGSSFITLLHLTLLNLLPDGPDEGFYKRLSHISRIF